MKWGWEMDFEGSEEDEMKTMQVETGRWTHSGFINTVAPGLQDPRLLHSI